MERELKADEVKKLPVGTAVRVHYTSGSRETNWESGTVVSFQKYKAIRIEDPMKGITFRVIADIPGTWFGVEDPHGRV